MRVLTTSGQVSKEISRLIDACSSLRVAVAWASVGLAACDLIAKHRQKIKRMVAGTHFYPTHPDFIELFVGHPGVRFVMKTDTVFHPKVYCFEMSAGEWECIIGSPNFTKGGLGQNAEIALLVTHDDDGAPEVFTGILAAIDTYWKEASQISTAELDAYREVWRRKQPILRTLQGKFGDPKTSDADDKGKAPLDVPILRMTWQNYFDKVKSEERHHNLEGRLRVIRATSQLFADHSHFNEIDRTSRQRIAGVNLKQIGIAMMNYHDQYHCLPPAYYADASGKPIHSWRVLLLPYLGQDALYKKYRFDEPWDGPNNRKLHATIVDAYSCPEQQARSSRAAATETSYVVVVGP